MIKTMLKNGLGRFERRYGYDAAYLREIVEADTGAGVRLMMAMGFLGHDFGVPADMVFAAKIRSALRADCGPCLRLTVDMAREAGLGPETLLPALGHGEVSGDVDLAIRYADAVLDNADQSTGVQNTRSTSLAPGASYTVSTSYTTSTGTARWKIR